MSMETENVGSSMDILHSGDSNPMKYHKKQKIELPLPNTLASMTKGLRILFDSEYVDVEEVKKYMSSYKSNPSEWKQYAKFDAHKYTRNLIDEGNGKYNLMLLCWGEGNGSSIHDHSDSHCFYKIMQGSLTETLYNWPKGKKKTAMTPKQTVSLKENEVGYMNDTYGLHRVENRSHTERAVSLHLYSPPFDMCQSFDERSGHVTKCKVTFWSKFGDRTPLMKSKLPEPENN